MKNVYVVGCGEDVSIHYKLHVTNLMLVFVATFRKYLGSFVQEVFLISFHYTQFFFEAEISPHCTAFIRTCAF